MTTSQKGPCNNCGSSDGNHTYDDGSSYCFVCKTYTGKGKEGAQSITPPPAKKETPSDLPDFETSSYSAIPDRRISSETAKFYGVLKYHGETSEIDHAYPYYDEDGTRVAAKLRKKGKKAFMWQGESKKAVLFGQNKFPPNSAKQITITEGELDALAAYQMQGSLYPVVSVHNAGAAQKNCAASWEYLNSFKTIVLCFDADKKKFNPLTGETSYPGQEAAEQVARLFPIGKVRIVTFAKHKDACDYLVAGEEKAFMQEWWNAPTYKPQGLVKASDMWEDLKTPRNLESVPYPWKGVNTFTYGIRLSEMVVLNAPTKVGKTTILKEMQHYLLNNVPDSKLGIMHLEEPNHDTALGLMSIQANKRLHLPDIREATSEEELKKYFDAVLDNDRIILFNHFGSNDIETILTAIRYMASMGCKYIFLDHLSILVSGNTGDERKQLDEATTKLKMLCMELNIALITVIHQNRQGLIRGTAGVEQLANIVIRLSRDKLNEDNFVKSVIKLVIQENRFTGETGTCCHLKFENDTGRLSELSEDEVHKFTNLSSKPKEEFSYDKRNGTGQPSAEQWP